MNITSSIRALLYQYDCVVVPGFGAFIGNYSPAKIHPIQHRFYPPSKNITFNQMLMTNDGLLAHHYSGMAGMTYEKAIELIAEIVVEWNQKLSKGFKIELDDIGVFINDAAGNLQFQSDEQINFLKDSFGLTVFQSLPIERQKPLHIVHKKTAEERMDSTFLPVLNRVAKYSVAAAIISIGFLTVYKLNLADDLKLVKVGLNPFKKETTSYVVRDYKLADFKEQNELKIATEELESEVPGLSKIKFEDVELNFEFVVDDRDKTKVAEKSVLSVGNIHVVGGCFGVEANAHNLVKKLKKLGYQARIAGMHRGLHVVSYQSFANKKEAEAMLNKVKSEHNEQAWLLIK